MASTTLAVASGALRLGIAGGTSPAGADTVYGFSGTDTLSTGAQRATGGDRFLDDAGGTFDATLGYALAFQNLLAEAWKGEPSVILRHLDQDGSCAPAVDKQAIDATPQDKAAVPADPTTADLDIATQELPGEGGDADFADGGIAGGDLFGMS